MGYNEKAYRSQWRNHRRQCIIIEEVLTWIDDICLLSWKQAVNTYRRVKRYLEIYSSAETWNNDRNYSKESSRLSNWVSKESYKAAMLNCRENDETRETVIIGDLVASMKYEADIEKSRKMKRSLLWNANEAYIEEWRPCHRKCLKMKTRIEAIRIWKHRSIRRQCVSRPCAEVVDAGIISRPEIVSGGLGGIAW